MDAWSNLGALGRVARDHAIQNIDRLQDLFAENAPQGFRIICNFTPPAGQSQSHAHLHIHAHQNLDASRFAPTRQPWLDAVDAVNAPVVFETQNTRFYDITAVLEAGQERIQRILSQSDISVDILQAIPPLALLATPCVAKTQYDFWEDVGAVGADTVAYAQARSNDYGFRLVSNFPGQQRADGWGQAHILVIGGAPINWYSDYS